MTSDQGALVLHGHICMTTACSVKPLSELRMPHVICQPSVSALSSTMSHAQSARPSLVSVQGSAQLCVSNVIAHVLAAVVAAECGGLPRIRCMHLETIPAVRTAKLRHPSTPVLLGDTLLILSAQERTPILAASVLLCAGHCRPARHQLLLQPRV